MTKEFEQAQWIWNQKEIVSDDYAEFIGHFECGETDNIYLNISADSNCNVYVNDKLVFFKQFTDYPYHKIYDHIDISQFCKTENELRITVWYYGKGNASYYCSAPGVIFEIVQNEKLLLVSGENIQSRTDSRYKIAYEKLITRQLGYSFFFDNTMENVLPFQNSVIVEKTKELHRNSLKPLQMMEKTEFQILRQDEHCALIDLGREEVGFLTLELNSPAAQTVTIAYGEHIADGKVRRIIEARDFSAEVRLGSGINNYCNTYRRLAGRYLEIFYEQPIEIKYLGLTPVMYPVKELPFIRNNSLEQRIYDTAVRTLRLSMHEHYEDCPWREQAMYVLDSRNQMLCGYYCFENDGYARENLILMSKGIKEDGLLELTYPAKDTPTIPFFCLMYPVAVREYILHTGDESILPLVMPTVERILQVFRKKTAGGKLISNFSRPYWNFYEWSKGSSGEDEAGCPSKALYEEPCDLILNCAYILAEKNYEQITGIKTDVTWLKKQIHKTFYNEQAGMYCASTYQMDLFTELGNSLAILTDVARGNIKKEIANKLMYSDDMVKVTLSMQCFKYDALLMMDSGNKAFIKQNIESIYKRMLEAGATSFWETEKGEGDFGGAGSLCHGWAAMPVYYYHIL